MKSSSVYLAGPISGTSFHGCNDWREAVAKELAEVGVTALSPLRGKKARLESVPTLADHYDDDPLTRLPGIVGRDRFDVMRADAILVNVLGARKVSIGTVMEIAWADILHKPIVLAMEPQGNPHEHGMLTHVVSYRVPTLEDAVWITKVLLGD